MLALFVALGFLFAALFGVGITGIFVVGARYDEEDLFSEQAKPANSGWSDLSHIGSGLFVFF